MGGVGFAQDYNLNPNYGQANLQGGFSPDPYVVNLQAGGSIDVSQRNGACRGHITAAPDFRLNFRPGSLPLIISAASSGDTTLIINGPNGQYYCDDDSGVNGLNPAIRFDNPMSGRYDIWVGTFGAQTQPAQLHISELYSQ
ncbi:MAG: peptidase S1 [Alphaproteobacteria bacterium]|nr:peptidase S1 [Alphaproteobacteria bacterium]